MYSQLNPSEDGFHNPTVIPYPIFILGDPEFTYLLVDIREEGGVADYHKNRKGSELGSVGRNGLVLTWFC